MFCPYCGKEKQDSQFYKSPIKTGEYIKPCKSCVTELYKQALESTKDQGAALWSTCMQTGIPMRRAEYTACLDTLEKAAKGKKPSLFMLYHTYLSTSPDKLTGVWDSDMELSNFKDLGDVAKGATDEVALKQDGIANGALIMKNGNISGSMIFLSDIQKKFLIWIQLKRWLI